MVGEEVEVANLIAAASRPGFIRMIAWTVLEGRPDQLGDLRFGRILSDRLRAEGWKQREAQATATEAMVVTGGWALLKPALVAVNGLDSSRAGEVESSLTALAVSLVDRGTARAVSG